MTDPERQLVSEIHTLEERCQDLTGVLREARRHLYDVPITRDLLETLDRIENLIGTDEAPLDERKEMTQGETLKEEALESLERAQEACSKLLDMTAAHECVVRLAELEEKVRTSSWVSD